MCLASPILAGSEVLHLQKNPRGNHIWQPIQSNNPTVLIVTISQCFIPTYSNLHPFEFGSHVPLEAEEGSTPPLREHCHCHFRNDNVSLSRDKGKPWLKHYNYSKLTKRMRLGQKSYGLQRTHSLSFLFGRLGFLGGVCMGVCAFGGF